MVINTYVGLSAVLLLLGCASTPMASGSAQVSAAVIAAPNKTAFNLRRHVSKSQFTVVTFFSAHCPCQRAHDERLRALSAKFGQRGVQFVAVDSEVNGSVEQDYAEARLRQYPFRIERDEGAHIARELGAEYATYTVILDTTGKVRYRGGIDSDRTHLQEDRTRYVEDALVDLLQGREPRVPMGKTLGCALRTQ